MGELVVGVRVQVLDVAGIVAGKDVRRKLRVGVVLFRTRETIDGGIGSLEEPQHVVEGAIFKH